LAENGFIEGKTIVIDEFNAHGDISVGNSIAKEMVGTGYDLLLTMSTLSLQAVANANRGGKTVQVFGGPAKSTFEDRESVLSRTRKRVLW